MMTNGTEKHPASKTSESLKEVVPADVSGAWAHFVAGNDFIAAVQKGLFGAPCLLKIFQVMASVCSCLDCACVDSICSWIIHWF